MSNTPPTEPRTLPIGYRDYAIAYVVAGPLSTDIGNCNSERGVLTIEGTLDPVEKANTIVHEGAHAALKQAGIYLDDDEEERVVRALSNYFVEIVRRDPAFAAWFMWAVTQ